MLWCNLRQTIASNEREIGRLIRMFTAALARAGHRAALALAICTSIAAAPSAQARSITVSTTAQLTAAVLDPANDGTDIVILPGKYVLTVPLDLREGMNLLGPNTLLLDASGIPQPLPQFKGGETFTDPNSEAIIDGSRLPGDPLKLVPLGNPGVVIAGRNNTISGLTIIGNNVIDAAVDVANSSVLGGARVVVTSCILENGRRGVGLFAYLSPFDGTLSTASIQSNVSRNNTAVFGLGIQVLADTTQNASWNVDVSSNRVYANVTGLLTAVIASQGSSIQVHSSNNLYIKNSVGIRAIGGRDEGLGAAVANNTHLQSVSDVIANNAAGGGALGGGVVAEGGQGDMPGFASGVTGNSVELQFFYTVFTTGSGFENGMLDKRSLVRSDLVAIGAAGAQAGLSTGPGNTVTLLIRNAQSDGAPGAFVAQNTLNFTDPGGSNQVLIAGSDVAIERTNSGVPPILVE